MKRKISKIKCCIFLLSLICIVSFGCRKKSTTLQVQNGSAIVKELNIQGYALVTNIQLSTNYYRLGIDAEFNRGKRVKGVLRYDNREIPYYYEPESDSSHVVVPVMTIDKKNIIPLIFESVVGN